MKLTNFNVKYAVLFAVLGAMLYGAVINGQMVAFLNRLLPPSERPLSDQIIHIEPEQQEEEFYLPASGTYRLIFSVGVLYASNITIHEPGTGGEIPRTILDRTELAPYDTENLQGIALFDFEVDKAGTYVIKIHDVDVTKRAFKLAIFPHSLVPQQIFLAILGIFIIGSVGYLIWTNQPVLSKKERKVKQDKWDEFMEEN